MAATEAGIGWGPPAHGGRWGIGVGRKMVEAFRGSGLSQEAFARRHGVHAQRIRYWLDRVAVGSGQAASVVGIKQAAPMTFAPVRVVEARGAPVPSGGEVLEIVVGAAVVRVPAGFDAEHLRRVMAALQGASC